MQTDACPVVWWWWVWGVLEKYFIYPLHETKITKSEGSLGSLLLSRFNSFEESFKRSATKSV